MYVREYALKNVCKIYLSWYITVASYSLYFAFSVTFGFSKQQDHYIDIGLCLLFYFYAFYFVYVFFLKKC
jgi:hypothetical protein